jgi:hypothetical protein
MRMQTSIKICCLLILLLLSGCAKKPAKVMLELFTASSPDGRDVTFGRQLADLSQNSTDPDTAAHSLIVAKCKPSILHSTSWRWEKNGTLILTYLAFSEDPKCLTAEPSRL